jgi:tetratricopeptide (TPR) repeat protein
MRDIGRVLAAGTLGISMGLGCGGAPKEEAKAPTESRGSGGPVTPSAGVEKGAREKFNAALDGFNGHDKANDWNEQSCAETAKMFMAAATTQSSGRFPEAHYDAGLAFQRCGDDKDAKARFQQALSDDDKFHFARAQLALYQFKADGNLDGAIAALETAVNDANFQNVPALVDLAMFQMQRDSEQVGANCHARSAGKDVELADFDCAKLNLQRALALDEGYMPAFNQLALYYFGSAKKKAGAKKFGRTIATNAALGKRGDMQQLELAALVCSQAIRKDAGYAPIHNTRGLILNELGRVNTAVSSFQTAAKLDPHFFEALMNLAAINLSFRGFDKAEGAYRKALEMHQNDYDAHLGLALALRGQIDDSNYDKQVAAVQGEIDACKKLDPARPDSYFNEGILTQEYKAKIAGEKDKAIAVYHQAKQIFETFMDKASGKPEYDGAVKKAKERMQDMDDMVKFLELPGPTAAPPPSPVASSVAPATSGSGSPPVGSPAPAGSGAPGGGGGSPAMAPSGASGSPAPASSAEAAPSSSTAAPPSSAAAPKSAVPAAAPKKN